MLRRLAVLVMTAWWWLTVSPELGGDVHTRNYSVQQFKSFVEAARRYIELSKGEPLIHRNVVNAINGLTDLLEASRNANALNDNVVCEDSAFLDLSSIGITGQNIPTERVYSNRYSHTTEGILDIFVDSVFYGCS